MAVYTLINKSQLESLLAYYDIGELVEYSPIVAGTTNSNYKLNVINKNNNQSYVLTIIEQNLDQADLDFCVNFSQHLANLGIKAAAPIKDRFGSSIRQFLDKPILITPYVNGESIISNSKNLLPIHCQEIGQELGRIHQASRSFNLFRKNPAGLTWCINIFKQLDDALSPDHYLLIKDEIEYLLIQQDLIIDQGGDYIRGITGAVHADLFCDNTIFDNFTDKNNTQLAGIIDFFYACTDYYLYDLAIVVNDWVLDTHNPKIICQERYQALITSYLENIKTNKELYQDISRSIKEIKDYWQVMLRQAALRFWLLRLCAEILQHDSGIKTIKDPKEYELKLLFHREQKLALI